MAGSSVHAITSVGVDLGVEGYLCAIFDSHEPHFEPMPVIENGNRKTYNIPRICNLLNDYRERGVKLMLLEQQQVFPRMGAWAAFSKGQGFGIFKGILTAMGVPFDEVRPSLWKKKLGICGRGDQVKAASIECASRLFPKVDLRDMERSPRARKPDDNKAESLLLAELAYRAVTRGESIHG